MWIKRDLMKNKTFIFLRKTWPWRILTLLALVTLLPLYPIQIAQGAGPGASILPGHSDRILRLKFVESTPTDNLAALLPAEAWQVIQKIDPLFTLPKSVLKELKAKGDERLKKEKGDSAPLLPDLSLWYEVLLVQGTDAEAAMALFSALPGVETIEPAPLITEPPTGDFTALQGYLGPATDGVNAQYAWTIPGGTGAGITIYDVEYGWVQDHEDLSKALNVPLLLNPGDTARSSYTDHGTAVLGELIADKDGKGITGIAYGATIKLAPSETANLGVNPANAILLSAADGQPGDVILVEQQTWVCNLDLYGPSEWDTPVYQAILTAATNGLIVVEAAGNGGVDLDRSECLGRFNHSTRDSGAILVGAGKPPASGFDRQRESSATWASSYGSRVDLQGWGSGVMTTGYGDYYGYNEWLDAQYFYTNTFKGTSSAAPMVAGAAAILQAVAIQRNGAPLTPLQVRDLLVQTGSLQMGNTAEHIGPRPDLRQAIANLPAQPPKPLPFPPMTGILLNPADPDGSNGWYRSAPVASVIVLRPSGIVGVRCALDPDVVPTGYRDLHETPCPFLGGAQVAADGPHTLYTAAMDQYGNQGSLVAVTWQLDSTPPALTCPQAGPFLLNSGDQAVGPVGVDGSVSGLDEAASTLSGPVSTAAVGSQSLTFTAFDLAGNHASQACRYNVIYDFSGIYPPVAQAPALNPVTAGSTIPLKWRLLDANGSPVTNLPGVAVTATSLPCPAGATQDQIEEYSSGSSSLQVLGDGYYQWNWKSPATYAGSCKTLKLNLGEGAGYEHFALFKFK